MPFTHNGVTLLQNIFSSLDREATISYCGTMVRHENYRLFHAAVYKGNEISFTRSYGPLDDILLSWRFNAHGRIADLTSYIQKKDSSIFKQHLMTLPNPDRESAWWDAQADYTSLPEGIRYVHPIFLNSTNPFFKFQRLLLYRHIIAHDMHQLIAERKLLSPPLFFSLTEPERPLPEIAENDVLVPIIYQVQRLHPQYVGPQKNTSKLAIHYDIHRNRQELYIAA